MLNLEILLAVGVFDDWHNQFIVVVETLRVRAPSFLDALDHLLMGDAELLLEQQCRHYSVLRVRVNHRACAAHRVRVEKQRRALARRESGKKRRRRRKKSNGKLMRVIICI